MNYPKRGEMSEDGLYYTHTDGSVFDSAICDCRDCDVSDVVDCKLCGQDCKHGWLRIEGAYVPSADEQEACEMARAHIKVCCLIHVEAGGGDCRWCGEWYKKSCPARAYLAAHGDANAWEVTP